MKRIVQYILRWFVFCCFSLLPVADVQAQKVLSIEKIGRAKHFFYRTNHKIRIHTGNPDRIVAGLLTGITDSTVTINYFTSVFLDSIHQVDKPRSFWLHSTPKWFAASAVYAIGSIVNNWITGSPGIDNTILPVSGSLIGIGTTSYLLSYRKLKIGDTWKLKVLDFRNPTLNQ